ncbi:MAG: hypothetical protein ACRDQ4_15400 [Pseudonocardiaceae bacterium]
MRVSEIFAMGGNYGHDRNYGYGYYPDDGRWSYHYYQSYGNYCGYGYGYSRSHGLLGVLG